MHDVAPKESAKLVVLGESRKELGLEKDPESPASVFEAAVLVLFSQVLGLEDIGVTDSFFDLGGDSLAGATLMSVIERDFGVVLPVSALLEAQTPRLLGALVKKGTDGEYPTGCVVSIRPKGSGLPLFCVHSLTGDVAYARSLAAVLGPLRPVYGLRAFGLQDNEIPLVSVASVAERYLAEIRTVQPTGPYLLAGFCGGAIVTYEMAQQLRAAGQAVSGLILIDPAPLSYLAPWLTQSPILDATHRSRAVVRLVRSQLVARSGRARSGERRRGVVQKSLEAAIALYRPRPYDGGVLLLHSREQRDRLLGSERSFPSLIADLKVVESAPDHDAILRSHLKPTAEIVGSYLDTVAPTVPHAKAALANGAAVN